MTCIVALILTLALEFGVPPNFALAIALTENTTLNPNAVSRNNNGTFDYGIMQLNSSWYTCPNWRDPESNIRAGLGHIKWLLDQPKVTTYWATALCYNAGLSRLERPPQSSLRYADNVINKWHELEPDGIPVLIKRR